MPDSERIMPSPGLSPSVGPCIISGLIHELRTFDPEVARLEYPWADRFVMGLPLVPWQREFKWDEEQSRRFITSAWSGVHLGTYIVTDMVIRERVPGPGVVYEPLSNAVIEGQQRLKSIELYVTDQLAVPNARGELTLWSELPRREQRRFENTIFNRGVIRELDERKLKAAYNLMNYGGTPHRESERAVMDDAQVGQAEPDGEVSQPGPRG